MKQKKYSIRALITVAVAVIMMMAMSITSFAAVSKVTGLKQTGATISSATITWNADSSAYKYNIYISDSKTGAYTGVGYSRTTQYTVTGLHSGTAYYVKVSAVATNGKEAEKSVAFQIITAPDNINSATISQNAATSSSIGYKWDAVKGVSGYMVYEGSKKLKTVTTASVVLNSEKGKIHTYSIYPYKKSYSGFVAKGNVIDVKGYALPGKMEKLAVESAGTATWNPETNEVRVSWKVPAGNETVIAGYQLEVYSLSGKSKLASYTVNAGDRHYKDFIIDSVKNKGFQVRVRAYVLIDYKKYYCEWSSKKVVVPPAICNKKVFFPSSGKMKFSWKAVPGATKYHIYAVDGQTSSYNIDKSDLKKIATVRKDTTSYTLNSLKRKKYTFICVVPVVEVNGRDYLGLKYPYSFYIK